MYLNVPRAASPRYTGLTDFRMPSTLRAEPCRAFKRILSDIRTQHSLFRHGLGSRNRRLYFASESSDQRPLAAAADSVLVQISDSNKHLESSQKLPMIKMLKNGGGAGGLWVGHNYHTAHVG